MVTETSSDSRICSTPSPSKFVLCMLKILCAETCPRNPNLGSFVRNFTNCRSWHGYYLKDATDSSDPETLIKAARNLTRLTKASFTKNPLATTVVASLPTYSHLSHLKIEGFSPKEYIWSNHPTSLTTLEWNMLISLDESPLSNVNFLLSVVESTCPDLTSLDIVSSKDWGHASKMAISERVQQYLNTTVPAVAKIRLNHFGVQLPSGVYRDEPKEIERSFLETIERHRHLLKSVVIPIPQWSWTREGLDFILKVCRLLPNLSALSLSQSE